MHTQKSNKISTLDYYVKFVFSCEDGVYTTTDRDWLGEIKAKGIEETLPVQGFEIDDILIFPSGQKYRITNIKVSSLYIYTTDWQFGYDGKAGGPIGKEKIPLFGIYIDMVNV